jgi:hypothetical protein
MKTLSAEKMENVQGGGFWGCAAGWVAVGAVATVAAVAVVGTGGAAAAAGAAIVTPGAARLFAAGVVTVLAEC